MFEQQADKYTRGGVCGDVSVVDGSRGGSGGGGGGGGGSGAVDVSGSAGAGQGGKGVEGWRGDNTGDDGDDDSFVIADDDSDVISTWQWVSEMQTSP